MKTQYKIALSAGMLAIAIPMTADAVILVGWELWNTAAPTTNPNALTAASSAITGTWTQQDEGASTDGTFGSVAGASTSAAGNSTGIQGYNLTNGTIGYEFTLTAGADNIELSDFHFDAAKRRNNSPNNWTVNIVSTAVTAGVVTTGTLATTGTISAGTDKPDFDISLTGLADTTLEAGESVTFQITITGGATDSPDRRSYLDNVAIAGTVVPEPTSLALLGLGSLLIARRRR